MILDVACSLDIGIDCIVMASDKRDIATASITQFRATNQMIARLAIKGNTLAIEANKSIKIGVNVCIVPVCREEVGHFTWNSPVA